jgi:phosphoribosylanthranilate isomerase
VRIKICGITNLDDAILCQDHGADALGFVFYEGSARKVDPQLVRSIISRLSPFVTTVGVFVNETAKMINQIAWTANLHAVQLHGDEPPAMLMQIDRPVIKAFQVNQFFDFNILSRFNGCVHLLDTYSEDSYGGSGQQFDWNIIPPAMRSKIILSGGVSADNIDTIMRTIGPAAVDLSSSVESSPGKKDPAKIERFFKKVNANRSIDAGFEDL